VPRGLHACPGISHVNTLGYGLSSMAYIYHALESGRLPKMGRDLVAFATEVGLPILSPQNSIKLGSALAAQGHYEEGITKMRQGLPPARHRRARAPAVLWLALQIEAYIETRQFEEGWTALEEALTIRPTTETIIGRPTYIGLKGANVQQSKVPGPKSKVADPRPWPPNPRTKPRPVSSKQLTRPAN